MLIIVSGAAPGVEQGAIEAAVNLALRWTGWASEQSILTVAPVYRTGLQPTSATDPGMVRRLNIQGADGALVFSTSMVTAGVAAFVDRWTERMGRAFLHVTLNPDALRAQLPDEVVAHVQRWIRDLPNGRVYVTGPSADDVPGIQGAVRDALIAVLEPFAVDEVRQTTRMMGLVEQAVAVVDALPEDQRSEMLAKVGTCPRCGAPHRARFCPCADGPTDCRGEPLDLVEVVERVQVGADGQPDESTRSIDILGPATSADLLDLDAVPEPVDSDAPRGLQPPGTAVREYRMREETRAYRAADPPEGLDELQRADLDASIREAERELCDPVEERVRAYHNLVATAPGPIGVGYHDDEEDEPSTPGDQNA